MALSSDELIKRQIVEDVGSSIGKIRIRIFPESSNEDQVPFSEGGLTFGYEGIHYGSCDVAWYIPGSEYLDGYNGKTTSNLPVIALEGTDALTRGSSGNAQYQRFHHALGAVKNGLIGIYYLRKGKHEIQPDLYGMAYNASQVEKGYYIITQDLDDVKELLYLIDGFGVGSEEVVSFLETILERMNQVYKESFTKKYKDDWKYFAKRRSTIFLEDGTLVKHAARCLNNFTKSAQRAGHIAVGEMYLTKYFFPNQNFYYFFPRMTNEEKDYLDKHKTNDKEWGLLRKEPGVTIKTMDDLVGLPEDLKQQLLNLREKPLKPPYYCQYKMVVAQIISKIESKEVNFK